MGSFHFTTPEPTLNPWHTGSLPKQLRKDWRPRDPNQLVRHQSSPSTQTDSDPPIDDKSKPTQSEISRVMAAMGRRGGKRRLVTLTAEQRKEIAVKAAKKRWENPRKD